MVATIVVVTLPRIVDAFWPFSSNADAAGSFLIPGADTPVLVAAINADPNPNKGLTDTLQTSEDKALVASGGPSGTIADVASSTAPGRISVYVVRSGDTLSEIAEMFGVTKNTVLWANNLKSAQDIHPGDTLIILPISGIERTVAKGDTLASLAKRYGSAAEEIAAYNGLDSSEALVVGSTIIIPGGELSVPTPVNTGRRTERYLGGSGAVLAGFFSNPMPGAIFTQNIHGWNGIDLGAPRGTPIYAAADGMVIVARNNGAWNGGYGNYVVITHPNGVQTLYAHMRSTIVFAGQSVASGQLIGYEGATGRATGPHLHFEVRGAANPFRNCRVSTVCSPQ